MIEGVRQLPPAHVLVLGGGVRPLRGPALLADAGSCRRREHEPGVISWASSDICSRSSVRSRLISDVPLGVFLSGGVDSTLVAAIAARCSTDPIKTFTVGYEEGDVNEIEPARAAAQLLGADHHALILSSARAAARRAVSVLSALDQPIGDQALIALHAVAEFARQDVTVAVGGEGADELFGGYPRYRWLARVDQVERRVPAPVLHAGAAMIRRSGRLAFRPARRSWIHSLLLERHIDWVTGRRRHWRDRLYGPALSARVDRRNVVSIITGQIPGDGAIGLAERFMRPRPAPLAARRRAGQGRPRDDAGLARDANSLTSIARSQSSPPRRRRPRTWRVAARRSSGSCCGEPCPAPMSDRAKVAFRVPAGDWFRRPLAGQLRRQVAEGAICARGLVRPRRPHAT